MFIKRLLLGQQPFDEAGDFLAFRYTFGLLLMWAVMPILALFILADWSGTNPIGRHGTTIRVHFIASAVLIWALRSRPRLLLPVIWTYAVASLCVHLSGFIFVPADELRLVWFYSLIACTYILLGKAPGALFTLAAIVGVLIANHHLAHPTSERGMGTFITSLISMSVIFHVFIDRIVYFHGAMAASKEELRKLSERDPLTGVLNGRAFLQACQRLMSLGERNGTVGAVLFIDLDHFKNVNDQHGHDAGDAVLRAVATCMARRLRQSDVLGRVGGEEFVAFLPSTDAGGAMLVAEELRKDIQQAKPVTPGGVALEVTASIGVALQQPGTTSFEDLQRMADQAMYQSKSNGRNRVTLFSDGKRPAK